MLPVFPETLAPPAPFPPIVSQSRTVAFVAPGIERASYRMQTLEGPLAIDVVAVDPREPTVRLGAVVADDRLVSSGETVSSMALRTGAVAGINGDYFDIGNTNQPLNVVVRDGALVRTPSKRIALDVRTDRSVHFENWSFTGTVSDGAASIPLTTVNEWPPQGGAGFVTRAYGTLRAAQEVTLAQLVPSDIEHDAATIAGSYRVATVGDALAARAVTGPLLAFGPAAKALGPVPAAGDTVTIAASTTPPLDDVRTAIGGGPLLLRDGAVADDPNAPAPEESAVRFPVSGAARTGAGVLLMAAVDGRAEQFSIGLTRPEFAALFLGLGATDAMAFDSGGSATLVARVLGDPGASVLNAPSDGEERPVADGLFAWSDAPLGPAAHLVMRPDRVVALPGVAFAVRADVVDAAGHALGRASISPGDVVRAGTVSETRTVRARGVSGTIAIDVVRRIAHLRIAADRSDPDPGAIVHFQASGLDERDRNVELGDAVRWRADRGTISADGTYRAADRNARIVAVAGGLRGEFDLPVGRHDVPLAVAPLELAYDFTARGRSASSDANLTLPGMPEAFALDVRGDRSGVGLRATFVNRFGERRVLWLARSVGWNDWQPVRIALPPDLTPPVRLIALAVTAPADPAAPRTSGTIGVRNLSATIAGTP